MNPSKTHPGHSGSPSGSSEVFVTHHALLRLREHHPHVGVRGALQILAASQEVDGALVAPFLGRCLEACRDRYFVTPGCKGVLVLVATPSRSFPWTMRTWLRFGPYQQSVALRLLEAA